MAVSQYNCYLKCTSKDYKCRFIDSLLYSSIKLLPLFIVNIIVFQKYCYETHCYIDTTLEELILLLMMNDEGIVC